MNYKNFDVEDIASDDSFIKWVLEDDEEARLIWETIRESDPDLRVKIDLAKSLLLNLRDIEPKVPSGQVNRIWNGIEKEIAELGLETIPQARKWSHWRIAASISMIIVFFVGAWYLMNGNSNLEQVTSEVVEAPADEFVTYQNETGRSIQIQLSDGSVVTVEDKSQLKYKKNYKGEASREVYLTGEAFFDIAKNPQQPFLVYANEIVTKVLGTSFRVKAYNDEKDIVVSVKEGKVSVFSANESQKAGNDVDPNVNGVILIPNQQVVYLRKENFFNKSLVGKPEIVKIEVLQNNFRFDNAPVKKVFAVLQEAYGVEILFDEDLMKNCFITVPLGKEPLYDKLKIICRTIGATYQLIDAKIVVSGKGC